MAHDGKTIRTSTPRSRGTTSQASLLLTGGLLRLGPGRATPGDLLMRHGRIAAIGPRGSLDAASRGTERLRLDGACVLPGFQDAHVHPAIAGEALLGIDLSPVHDLPGYRRIIAARAAAAPKAQVLTGVGWYGDLFPGGLPDATWLDEVVRERPVVLTGHDGHSTWLNTAALRAAGISADTPDPADGSVVRDRRGEPTGVLLDGAMRLVVRLLPVLDDDRLVEALLAAQARLHAVGVTAWQDAMVGDSELGPDPTRAYERIAADGRLSARVVQALWWDRERGLEQIPDLVARRAAASGISGISAHAVKLMQDGMVENRTAAMLEPYVGTTDRGPSFVDPGLLRSAVTALAGEGFDVHFHGVGDRAVRECLDAVEASRGVHGDTGLRHQVAHLDVVDPEDALRFPRLGVIANVQMLWARRDREILERKLPLLGRARKDRHFPFATLRRAGALLAAGSDWPVTTPDPLLAIHTAATRTAPRQDVHAVGADVHDVPLEPQEALERNDAIAACTTGAAFANRLEHMTGRLRTGFAADLVILDDDPAAAEEIGAITVLRTIVGGRTVHVADG